MRVMYCYAAMIVLICALEESRDVGIYKIVFRKRDVRCQGVRAGRGQCEKKRECGSGFVE